MLLALVLAGCRSDDLPPPTREQPNILLIVADDLGYSDLGAYGSEIPTPRLDALAQEGLKAQAFYVAPRGGPTRAMMITGVDNHVAGFGGKRRRLDPTEEVRPGYEGILSPNVVTVASLLGAAGYHTVISGKLELGSVPGTLPQERGFERSFALLDGAASHWSDMTGAVPGFERATYLRNGEPVPSLPEDHFSSRAFTDFVIETIDEWRHDGRPFFAVLAFQAPHGPLAAPDDWRDRFAGDYDEGFDKVRDLRLLRMKRLGLVHPEVDPYPGLPTIPAWKDLDDEQRKDRARRMELYAAMVANLDFHVGRLFDYLKEIGEYQDTLVVFLSDNGPEPGDRGPNGMDSRNREWFRKQFPETGIESWGRPGAFVEYGAGWAQVSSVPFRLFKGTQAEGGIRSPLIVAGPGVLPSRLPWRTRISTAPLHVMDLAPTFLELAGVEHPRIWKGRSVAPLQGKSLVPHFAKPVLERAGPHEQLAFAFAEGRALRRRRWKITWMPPPFGTDTWRLYRIDLDPSELYDKAKKKPAKVAELEALGLEYAKRNGVRIPRGLSEKVAGSARPKPDAER